MLVPIVQRPPEIMRFIGALYMMSLHRYFGGQFFPSSKVLGFVILALGVIFCASEPLCARVATSAKSTKANKVDNDTASEQYTLAKENFEKLERNESWGKSRENWLEGVRKFRKIYFIKKNEKQSVESLFMMGRMYRQMYERFHVPIDLENAIDSFYDVAALFPKNSLADDALYGAAEASLLHPTKKKQSPELLHKIITAYPKSDYAVAATDMLKQVDSPTAAPIQPSYTSQTSAAQQKSEVGTPNLEPEVVEKPEKMSDGSDSPKPGSLAGLAWIQAVKYWSSNDYTRIVIPATSAVPYTAGLLAERESQPRRIYVDFADSAISSSLTDPLIIDDGLLKQVRFGQHKNKTVRVVLDLESFSDYRIFSLPDPFRVIIDVQGKKLIANKEKKQSTPKKSSESAAGLVATSEKMSTESTFAAPPQVVALQDQKKKASLEPSLRGKKSTKSTKAAPLSLAQQLGLGVRKIVIDPGHGGKDPGAMAFGLKEKDLVLQVAKMVTDILSKQYGYQVTLTRSKDIFLPLEERTAIANTMRADLFVSIHLNAHPDKSVGGVETYFLNLATNADAMRVAALENATSTHSIGEMQDVLQSILKNEKIDESSRLAQFVQRSLAKKLGKSYKIKDLGVKQAPFYVLIGAEMPAVLTEISFITNPAEAKLLQQNAYLQKIAQEIVAGLIAYIEHHQSAGLLPGK